ncbi:hypothetical protein Cgig2_005759 [Carnegiea gigantea]|uniref:Uncharacterized protein n=1 Tax=Carnegiea gigantea TaxID=171969 RepID=A0A9Q1GKU0_9CARY|nr:hypothetical protein Cgig2_005759 [Carnegiea gigantea]
MEATANGRRAATTGERRTGGRRYLKKKKTERELVKGQVARSGVDGLTPTCHRQKGRPPPEWPSSHPLAPPLIPVARPLSFPLVQPLSGTGIRKSDHRIATPTTQRYSNGTRSPRAALGVRSAQQPPRSQLARSSGIRPESPSEEATGERQPHAGPTQSGGQCTQPSPQ